MPVLIRPGLGVIRPGGTVGECCVANIPGGWRPAMLSLKSSCLVFWASRKTFNMECFRNKSATVQRPHQIFVELVVNSWLVVCVDGLLF